jgi:ABC-type transporter MlaC component
MRVHTILDYPGRDVDLYADYLLRQRSGRWRIVDVLSPPTVSEVEMRRAVYADVLKSKGFDAMIAVMDQRIAEREEQD